MMGSRWTSALAASLMFGCSTIALAVPVTYDLTFETSGQSIWDTGNSFALDETAFLGAAWQDKDVEIDLIAGEGATVINPLREAYDLAFGACRLLGNSASACVNGQSGRVYVPRLGNRPSVRSCGKYAVGCKIARVKDLAARATYDAAFKLCRKGFSTTVCRNGQSARLPVVALGTAPPERLSAATGVGVKGTTNGRAGLELGIEIDSGSVDAKVSYAATLDIPDTSLLTSGATINFNPDSALAGVNSLETQFSSLTLNLDAIMELSGDVAAEACLIAAGCATGSTPFDIDERASILSFNEDGEGGVELLGRAPSAFGYPDEANGFPFAVDVAGLAEITLHLPQPDANGGLDASGQKLQASGQDDLLDLFLDVDNIIATAAGVPGLFGSSTTIAGVDVGFDIIDLQMGPTIDLKQNFELEPTLWVSLLFDEAVEIAGNLVTEWQSAWDMLPDITFLADDTLVTPTFFLEANLLNETLLDFDLEFMIDLLQITYGFDLLNIDGSIGIGNVLSEGVDLFESPDLFSNLFELQGFDLQLGDSFLISLGGASTLPDTEDVRSAVNPIVLPGIPADVPVSGTLLLILAGLFSVFARRREAWHAAAA